MRLFALKSYSKLIHCKHTLKIVTISYNKLVLKRVNTNSTSKNINLILNMLSKSTNPLNLLLILFLISFSLKSNAQEETKKSKFVAGSSLDINFSGSNLSDLHWSTKFGISPYFGWKPSENWVLGANVQLSNNAWSESAGFANTISNILGYGIGLFARYEKGLSNKLKIYAWNSVNFISSKYSSNDSSTFKSNRLSASIAPGFLYAINEKFNVLLQVGSISYDHFLPLSQNLNVLNLNFDIARPTLRFEVKF